MHHLERARVPESARLCAAPGWLRDRRFCRRSRTRTAWCHCATCGRAPPNRAGSKTPGGGKLKFPSVLLLHKCVHLTPGWFYLQPPLQQHQILEIIAFISRGWFLPSCTLRICKRCWASGWDTAAPTGPARCGLWHSGLCRGTSGQLCGSRNPRTDPRTRSAPRKGTSGSCRRRSSPLAALRTMDGGFAAWAGASARPPGSCSTHRGGRGPWKAESRPPEGTWTSRNQLEGKKNMKF